MPDPIYTLPYRAQHQLRLSYMPWLYWTLKPEHKAWAQTWQQEWQNHLQQMETVEIRGACFIAPEAKLFAEPGRAIIIEEGAYIAAECVLHGPILIGERVSLNHHCTLDGGRAGIHLDADARIACHTKMFAFNHGQALNRTIASQAVSSNGIKIGKDVWIGADVKVTDGVTLGDQCVVGMGSVVTKSFGAQQKIAGNPAKVIGQRVS